MTKQEFISELREALCGLPQEDLEERLSFYGEQIDDRMEEGLTEKEAVAAIGTVTDIVLQVVDEYPVGRLVMQKVKPKRRRRVWESILLAVGSPIWLSLLVAAFAVVLSLYVVLWAVIISFWSVFAALIGSAVGCLVGGVAYLCVGETPYGLVLLSAALVCAGLAIFAFFGCKAATKGAARLTKGIVLAVKKRCVRKGEAR